MVTFESDIERDLSLLNDDAISFQQKPMQISLAMQEQRHPITLESHPLTTVILYIHYHPRRPAYRQTVNVKIAQRLPLLRSRCQKGIN